MPRIYKKFLTGAGIAAAVGAAAYAGISTYYFKKKCKMGTVFVEGTVDEYKWQSSDKFCADDYPAISAKNGKVRILALTDTHLEMTGIYSNDRWTKHLLVKTGYRHIQKLIDASQPDLILLTGDILTDPLSDIVFQNIADFLDRFNIPWTMVFGNHDGEWRASKEFFYNVMEKSKNCIFQPGPTNLQGLGNSLINFKNADGKIFYSIILMDSGDSQKIDENKIWYSDMKLDKTSRRFGTVRVGINNKQTQWYRWVINGLKEQCGDTVETMLAMHFPLKAYEYAVRLGKFTRNKMPFEISAEDCYDPPEKFSKFHEMDAETLKEGYADYKKNYPFYKAIKELGSTKHIITGHNHCFGYTAEFDGISFTSVVKTTGIYVDRKNDHGKRGGTIFEISENAVNGTHIAKNQPVYIRSNHVKQSCKL